MPTALDHAMRSKSKGAIWAFGLLVVGASSWAIWGPETLPPEKDPKGDPKTWTREELRRWLAARNLFPNENDSDQELLDRVLVNMRIPRK
ncbi:Fc.00g047550.m01.CDS01 [Cosmosporella sp. VM-42]